MNGPTLAVSLNLPGPGTRPNPGHGVALDNVRARLRLLHDLDAKFEAGKHGEAWRVRIVVPMGERTS